VLSRGSHIPRSRTTAVSHNNSTQSIDLIIDFPFARINFGIY